MPLPGDRARRTSRILPSRKIVALTASWGRGGGGEDDKAAIRSKREIFADARRGVRSAPRSIGHDEFDVGRTVAVDDAARVHHQRFDPYGRLLGQPGARLVLLCLP